MDARYEARRYAAVLIRDPRVPSVNELSRLLQIPEARRHQADLSPYGVPECIRLGFSAPKNYYPEWARQDDGEGQFLHDLYVSALTDARGPDGTLLLASPYVFLLSYLVRTLKRSIGSDDLSFAKPRIEQTFDAFARAGENDVVGRIGNACATRATFQPGQDSKVGLVSLTGKKPLNSSLLRAIRADEKEKPQPYSIRLTTQHKGLGHDTNIHADRHGNFWWYLANELCLVNVLDALSVFQEHDLLEGTIIEPLRRMSRDDSGL